MYVFVIYLEYTTSITAYRTNERGVHGTNKQTQIDGKHGAKIYKMSQGPVTVYQINRIKHISHTFTDAYDIIPAYGRYARTRDVIRSYDCIDGDGDGV